MSSSPSPGAAATPAPTSPPSANATSPPPSSSSTPPPTNTPSVTPSAPPPSTTPSRPTPSASSPPPSSSTSPPAPTTASPPQSSSTSPPAPTTASPPPSSFSNPSPPSPSTSTPRSPGTPSRPPPSRSSGTPSRSSPPSQSGSELTTGMVVGIAIGGLAILLVLSLCFICCCKKTSRRRRRYDESYYVPPPPPDPKEDPYGGQQYRRQQNSPPPPPPPVNQSNAGPPKPRPPPVTAWRPSPMPPPPPPPLFMSSSGGSGSNYSGSETPLPPPSPGLALGFSKSTFTYEELVRATDGFSDANLLGQGGFGYVHRGVLPNGKQVAVKQLKVGSGQGEREFRAEVEIISRVHHKHLVSLVGYCISGTTRMLVYEFVPNNTLEFHLHGKGRLSVDWPSRMRIALGSAKGLAYLHEDCHPKIIHRDIKAANILLDFKFEAKVADFGLAKFTSDVNTHVSTRVMGTFGYLAPEYAASGKLTDKSDVFSFGVVLLELITGHRPVGSSYREDSLVDWSRPLVTRALEDGNFDSLADPKLQKEYNHDEMNRMVACAAACVRHSARRRPRMSQIVRALEGDASLSDLNEGMKPGQSNIYSSYESSEYDTSQYNEDMKRFKKMALGGTDEYAASNEYSEATSEYGLYPSGSSNEGQTTREMEMRKMKKTSQGFSGISTS